MTVAVRVIPCLDVSDGRVVKGVNFLNLRDAGDIELTDFTSLSATWRRDFGARACLFGPSAPR